MAVKYATYQDGTRGKNRPALVIQCDRNNRRLQNSVVAMITGNTILQDGTDTLLVDPATPKDKFRPTWSIGGEMRESLHRRAGRHSSDDRPFIAGLDGRSRWLSQGIARAWLVCDLSCTLSQADVGCASR